jgi:hypothetical protein
VDRLLAGSGLGETGLSGEAAFGVLEELLACASFAVTNVASSMILQISCIELMHEPTVVAVAFYPILEGPT